MGFPAVNKYQNLGLGLQVQSISESVPIHYRFMKTLKGFYWHTEKTNYKAALHSVQMMYNLSTLLKDKFGKLRTCSSLMDKPIT